MPVYRLTYFNARALAEPSRLVLHYAGQEFEDIRLNHDEWPTFKNSFPYQQIPVLEVDNKQLAQSGAILRYLARIFKLDGANGWECAKAEEIWFIFYDNFRAAHPYNAARLGHGEKGANVEKLHKEVFLPIANKVLPIYYKLVKSSVSGFLLPSGITYIDFVVAEHLLTLFNLDPQLAKKYPDLVTYKDKIHSITPQIVDYIKKRPQTLV